MIKLLDLLKEENIHNDTHWRDHLKEASACLERALTSNDPSVVAEEIHSIINHVEQAKDKIITTNNKALPPTFVNSNISNSYAGDDSDINAYQGQRI